MTTNLFTGAMQGLLDCVTDALTANSVPVGWSALVHGTEEAWDDCCDGMAYVRLVQVYPTMGADGKSPFPSQDTTHTGCGINAIAVRLAVGVLRCAATEDNNGNPPTPTVITGEAEGIALDASIMLEALMCCFPSVAGVMAAKIDSWQPKPTLGGCRGGEWQILVALGHCGCP